MPNLTKPNILIIGPSGSGKSTSLRNLDPNTVQIIDIERKGLPFKGEDRFKITPVTQLAQLMDTIGKVKADPSVKYCVIESFTSYVELLLSVARETQSGYDIYSFHNRHIGKFLNGLKNEKVTFILTGIDEIVKIEGVEGVSKSARRIAVSGKEWEGKIEKEFLIVLYTELFKTKEGNIKYQFRTNGDGTVSAKSPDGMLPLLMPNDLSEALVLMEKYRSGQ